MESLIANKQEQQNTASYSSDASYRNFHIFGLKGLEKQLVSEYFTSKRGKVLDLGCGYGRTTVPLAEMGYGVVGIDVVSRMIETAKAEHPEIDYRLMSATDLEFEDSSFDYALFSFNGIDCIYPEQRRQKALSEIRRVLKSGGICILTSHNSATLLTRIKKMTPVMFWRTLRAGLLLTPYILGPYDGGDQIAYCQMPWIQKRNFRREGFEVIKITSKVKRSWLGLNLFETWPYYVLRKI